MFVPHGVVLRHDSDVAPGHDNQAAMEGWPHMKALGMGRGVGIGVALLALPVLCPISRGDEAAATPRGAWIGVSTRGLSDGWRDREEYWARGVMVVEVARGSPADQAGMGPGDVLVSVDSHTLQNPSDLEEVEGGLEPGRAVPVVLARDGGRMIKIFNLEPGPVPGASGLAPTSGPKDAVAPATPEPAVAAASASVTLAAASGGAPQVATAEARRSGTALAVRCENLSFDLADALGVPEGQGVLVLGVTDGGPADKAGIHAGDVISWVGGQPVADVNRLEGAVAVAPSPVTIVTRRGETTRNVTAEFEAHPATAGGDAAAAQLVGDPLVAALREEVRSLRAEVQKLREEMAAMVKASAARQP